MTEILSWLLHCFNSNFAFFFFFFNVEETLMILNIGKILNIVYRRKKKNKIIEMASFFVPFTATINF